MILVSGKLLAATVRNVTVLSVPEDKDRLGSTLRVELEGKILTLTTTDRYRLIVARVPVINVNDESWEVNVNGLAFNDICKGVGKVREVTITCNPDHESTPVAIDYPNAATQYVLRGAIDDSKYPSTVHIDRNFEGVFAPCVNFDLSPDTVNLLGKLKFGKGVKLTVRSARTRSANASSDRDFGFFEYRTSSESPVDYRVLFTTMG